MDKTRGTSRILAGCKQNGLSDEDAQALVEKFETAGKPPPAK